MNPEFDGILWRASNALCAPVTLGSFAAVFVASLGAGGSARVWGRTVGGAGWMSSRARVSHGGER